MSGAESFVPTPLLLSDNAQRRLKALMAEDGASNIALRVYVTGGGCSGFQYGFDVADGVNDDDTAIPFGDVSLVVDPLPDVASDAFLAAAESVVGDVVDRLASTAETR